MKKPQVFNSVLIKLHKAKGKHIQARSTASTDNVGVASASDDINTDTVESGGDSASENERVLVGDAGDEESVEVEL